MIPTLSLGLLLSSAAGAWADPPAAEQKTLDAFAAANKTCQSWTDHCIVCERQGGGAYACSTPGAACQPVPLTCEDPSPPPGIPR